MEILHSIKSQDWENTNFVFHKVTDNSKDAVLRVMYWKPEDWDEEKIEMKKRLKV